MRGWTGIALASVFSLITAKAEVIGYHGNGGGYLFLNNTGNLINGPFDGVNIADITSNQYIGIEDSHYHLIDSAGLVHQYNAVTGARWGAGTGALLVNGPLAGEVVKNDSFLGTTGNLYYYDNGDGGVIIYRDESQALWSEPTWAIFTTGELNGKPLSEANVLYDFGGGVAMYNGWLLSLDGNGTLEYYNLNNGVYNSGLSDGGYGNWDKFTGGELDGLTLTYLQSNPEGVYNGISYRFLGPTDDIFYFSIHAVPEPSVALLAGLSLAGLGWRRRR